MNGIPEEALTVIEERFGSRFVRDAYGETPRTSSWCGWPDAPGCPSDGKEADGRVAPTGEAWQWRLLARKSRVLFTAL